METSPPTPDLIPLLNRALVLELTVCLEYMLQHAVGAAQLPDRKDKTPDAQRVRFAGSHSYYFFPRPVTLKKIAITAMSASPMRHAVHRSDGDISERIVQLGGEPATQANPFSLQASIAEMLAADADLERHAIEFYGEIIDAARAAGDERTAGLFEYIRKDEVGHLEAFEGVLEA